jgi:uncharacterized protein YbjT (DUF2867 family)
MVALTPLMAAGSRVLVAGATGLVGGLLARKLLAAGFPVRAIGRNQDKLAALSALGAEAIALDLRDRAGVALACEGVTQVFSSVNNVLGQGAASPNRVDLQAHDVLCDAARDAGVKRFVYLSFRGMSGDMPVDFFRLKRAIEERVRQSGIPYVLIRPSAFMDIWSMILLDDMRKKGVAVLFGSGQNPVNFISCEDVAEFSLRVMQDDTIRNEAVEIGGPSDLPFDSLVTLLETRTGLRAKRRKVPIPVLWWGGLVLRPFSELGARLMRMGYFTATRDGRFPDWQVSARRFGVTPITIEAFVGSLPV